jgi:hypothetical protein
MITRRRAGISALLFAVALGVSPAQAWEPQTTHAGLAEQAALSSRLHRRLVAIGFSGGLFEPLTIPPADAPALIESLHLLSPSHGSVPDARGRQTALAWISAGAALADVPARHAVNHFYDPALRIGWRRPGRGVILGLSDSIREAIGRASLPGNGKPAIEWVTAKENPFNLAQFLDQYGKAVSAPSAGERSRHMAAALVAAGGMLHVLADVGVPSRVRGDEAAHFAPLGGGPDDLGSRFERIAALAYGRLGVPAPSRVITRQHLRDYFSNAEGTGLADATARTYFSPGTLPQPARVGGDTRPHLVRPQPALPARLNLMAASRDDGTTLRDGSTCLARYKVEHGVVRFHLDDECMLEQIGVILPEVAAYETGLLEFLLRGELALTIANGQLVVSGTGFGTGELDVLVEDERGVRTSIGKSAIAANQADLARLAPPQTGIRVVAVFRGVDATGEPIVAAAGLPLVAP